MHTSLGPGAQMLFGQNWRILATVSLSFHCIDEYSCLGCWNRFFSSVFQVLGWSSLVLHFYGNVCNWIPKPIWSQMDWFWGFCWNMSFFVDFICVWIDICRNCSNLFLYWRHQVFSITNWRCILVCSLNVPVIFSRRIL